MRRAEEEKEGKGEVGWGVSRGDGDGGMYGKGDRSGERRRGEKRRGA